jgi:SAM-dependent methyltransferase
LWRAHSDQVNAALLEQWLPAGKLDRVLKTDSFDEAFSDGLYPLLARRARSVTSMDVSTIILRAAQANHGSLNTTGADTCRLPFADRTFDAIISNSTLDHLSSHDEITISLRELARVLRPDGVLILTLDNPDNPAIALRNAIPPVLLKRLGVVPYYVGATCNARQLRGLLQQVGLYVLDVRFIMHHPSVLAVTMTRLLERYTTAETQNRFLRFMMSLEQLANWPTRPLSGHFVAVRAIKRA